MSRFKQNLTGRMATAALGVLLLFLSAAAARAQSSFEDNFDSYTNGSVLCSSAKWGVCATGNETVNNGQSVSAPNSALLNRNGTDASAESIALGPLAQKIVIEFNIYAIRNNRGEKGVILKDSTGNDAIGIRMNSSRRFEYNNRGAWTQICGSLFSGTTWYTVRIITDPSQTTDTFDISIDTGGTSFCSGTGLNYVANRANINKAMFFASSNNSANIYVDNLRIYNAGALNIAPGANNPAAANVDPAATNAAMLQVAIQETGGHEGVIISEVQFTASGSADDRSAASGGDISATQVCLYNDTGTTPGAWDAGDAAMGACTNYSADNGTATFTGLAETINAGATENWLLVYKQLAGTALSGETFAAALGAGTATGADSGQPSNATGTAAGNTMTVFTGPPNATAFTNGTEPALNNLGARTTQTVTITGTGFGASCAAPGNVVKIGAYTVSCADVATWNNTTITFTLNTAIGNVYGGLGALVVRANAMDDTTPLNFLVYPRVTGLSPACGAAGTAVSVQGDHLCQGGACPAEGSRATAANNVTFFSGLVVADLAVTAWGHTQIDVTAPVGTQTGDVTVTSNSLAAGGALFDTTPPAQSNWNPPKFASILTTAPTITFDLDTAGDCKWSLNDLAYSSMAGDCTGDGTTSMACATSGLPQGAAVVYVSCRSTCGGSDTAATNENISYTIDEYEPLGDEWWNPSWAYRMPVQVSKPGGFESARFNNGYVNTTVDFAAAGFDAIDQNSLRMVRYNGSTWTVLPVKVNQWWDGDTDGQYDRANITFAVDKDDLKSSLQTAVVYYLYYDITSNGPKAAPGAAPVATLKILCLDNDNESQTCEAMASYAAIAELNVTVYEAPGLGALVYGNLVNYDMLYFGWNAISNDATYQLSGYEDDLKNYVSSGGRILCAASDNAGWQSGWLTDPGAITVYDTGDANPTQYAPFTTEIFNYPNANALNGVTEDEDYRNVNTGGGWEIMAQDSGTTARKLYLRKYWGAGIYLLSSVDARNLALSNTGRNYFENSIYWAWRWRQTPLSTVVGAPEWYTPDAMAFLQSDYSTPMTTAQVGGTLYIQMNGDDINSGAVGAVSVTLTSTSDPAGFTMTLTETGATTGILRGTATLATATNGPARQLKADVGGTITVSSITKLVKTATLTVAPSAPATITELDIKSDNTYTTSLTDTVDIGSTLYLQVLAADANPLSTDITTVHITSTTDAAGIDVNLYETGRNTGIFRGTATVSNSSNNSLDYIAAVNADTITVRSNTNPAFFDTCQIKNQPPTAIYSLTLYQSNYTTPLTTAPGGTTVYIEVVGQDGNSYSQDRTTVNVKSSITDPLGIGVQVVETSAYSGVFRGSVTLKAASNSVLREVGAASPGEIITATSDDDPTKFKTLTVQNTPPPSITGLDVKTDATYSTSLSYGLKVGQTIYMEITAPDANPQTMDTTVVTLKSSATDPGGISITLTQTSPTSTTFRGTATIKPASNASARQIGANAGETITIASVTDPTKSDIVNVVSTNPTSITSLTFMTNDTFSAPLPGSVAVGDNLYIEVVAVDLNPESRDQTTVYVISTSDPTGITVTLTESGINTGEFDGVATVSSISNETTAEIKGVTGDTVTAKSTVNQARLDTVSVQGSPPRGVFALDIYQADYTTPITQAKGGTTLYVQARGVDGNTGTTDKMVTTVTSTSDPVGIAVYLNEQGTGTEFNRPFRGTLTLGSASSQVLGTIKVAVGDTVTITSQYFVYIVDGSGNFWFEGEAANRLTPNMSANAGAGTSGGQYVYVPQGSYTGAAEYVVYKQSAGTSTYYLYGRTYAENAGGQQFLTRMDNAGEAWWTVGPPYTTWRDPWVAGNSFSLAQGAHVFRIRNTAEANDATRLDKGVLRTTASAPTGYGSTPATLTPVDTVIVPNTQPSPVASVILKTDGTYASDLITNVQIGNTLYIQLQGTDGDPYTLNTTDVTLKSSITDPAGISVTLTETAIGSGIFRGTATVAAASNDVTDAMGAATNEIITIASVANPARTDTVTVDTPAVLSLDTVSAAPAIVNRGQTGITVTFTVDNNGTAAANISAAGLSFTNNNDFTVTPSAGNPAQIAGGAQNVLFTFTVAVKSTAVLGMDTLDATITATDNITGANCSDTGAVTTYQWEVRAPGSLTTTMEAAPSPASTGQIITITMTMNNPGGNTVNGATPSALTLGGTSSAAYASGPSPVSADIPAGGSQDFTWTYTTALTAGTVNFTGGASGSDAITGSPVSSTPSTSNDVLIKTAANLSVTSIQAAPTAVNQGQNIVLTMRVSNSGTTAANNVTPTAPTLGGASTATLVSGPAPASASIPGSGYIDYVWNYQAGSQNGTVNFTAGADGADASSGNPVSAAPAASNDVTVQLGAGLSVSIVSPTPVSTGQNMLVKVTVTNTGESAASNVVPSSLTIGGAGSANFVTGPLPGTADIAPGASKEYTFGYTAGGAAGTVTFTGNAAGYDATNGAPIASAPATSNTATIQTKAALSSSITASPNPVDWAQTFTVTMTVNNNGQAAAQAVAPSALTLGGTSGAVKVSGPSPATAVISGGGQQAFTWTYTANATSGTVNFTGNATGKDANSQLAVSSGATTSDNVAIQKPAAITATISGAPATVNTGQSFTVTMTVQNTGEAYANTVAQSALVVGGTSSAIKVNGPTPPAASIPGGGQKIFTWTYTAGATPGTVHFTGSASGTDANNGAAIATGNTTSADQTVQAAGTLDASSISLRSTVNYRQSFTVTMTVTNNGTSQINNVTPTALTLGGAGSAAKISGPTPASANIPGGAQQSFSWTYMAGTVSGAVNFTGSASGTDSISGLPVSSGSNTSPNCTIQSPASIAVSSITSNKSVVNVGQTFTITASVFNAGQETVNALVPSALVKTGAGTATILSGPTPSNASLPGNATQTFTWTLSATGAGLVSYNAGASGTGNNSALAVTADTATTPNITITRGADLSASIAATPGQVSSGQTVTVTMTVTNSGAVQANVVAPAALTISGNSGDVTLATGPTPGSVSIPGGQSRSFVWTYTAGSISGAVYFTGSAAGTDANTGLSVSSNSDTSNVILIKTPANLTVSINSSPAGVGENDTITVTMTVNNTGGATANGVAPSALTLGGTSASATLVDGPNPASADIAGAGTKQFIWHYKAGAIAGTVNFTGNAVGTDANSGNPVTAAVKTSNDTQIQGPAALTSSIQASPSNPTPTGVITVTMTVSNTGGAQANSVAPSSLTLGGASTANYASGPSPSSADIAGGASKDFTWTYTAGAGFGTVNFTGSTTGTDANSGNPVASAASTSNNVNITAHGPLWVYPAAGTIGPVRSSPSIRNNTVFVGSDDDNLYAINATTGALKWTRNTGGDIVSTPYPVYDGSQYIIYFGSYSNYVYAVTENNAQAAGWPGVGVNIGNTIVSTTVVDGYNIFLGSFDQKVYAVDIANGSIVWTSPALGGSLISSPSVGDTEMYIGSTNGKLYALNKSDGTYLREFNTGGTVEGSAWVDWTGKLFIGSSSGKFYSLNASNFTQNWVWPTSGSVGAIVSSPWVEASKTAVYFGSNDGKVYALNTTTGLPLAGFTPYQTGNSVRSSPLVWNDVVYVGSDDGKVYAINADTGAILPGWPYDTTDVVFSSPGLFYVDGINDRIIIGSNTGQVFAFEAN